MVRPKGASATPILISVQGGMPSSWRPLLLLKKLYELAAHLEKIAHTVHPLSQTGQEHGFSMYDLLTLALWFYGTQHPEWPVVKKLFELFVSHRCFHSQPAILEGIQSIHIV